LKLTRIILPQVRAKLEKIIFAKVAGLSMQGNNKGALPRVPLKN